MNKEEALKEKNLGNQLYKAKKFEDALIHYDKAIEFDRTDMTFLTNKAAVHFEMGKWDDCIKLCQQAIDVGREHLADFKLIAKALARMASAYVKKDDLAQARTYYQKSLCEHRTPDTLSKLNEVEREIKDREAKAYIDPEKAQEERQKGNEFFQKGDYPTAIRHYTEAMKRNPEDAKIYSNRAACYQKLAEFRMAKADADECIKRDPKFVKGYIRKGLALLAMKMTSEAAEAFGEALQLDPNNSEAIDGYSKAVTSVDPEEQRQKALNNPEVQEILADPAMQMILTQGQQDPRAIREHLSNPEVARKFKILLQSGIIKMQ